MISRIACGVFASIFLCLPGHAHDLCKGEGKLHSKNSNVATVMAFTNGLSDTVNVYWLDFRGKRKFYKELPSGMSYDQQTYVTHPWIAVTGTGRCLGPFLPRKTGRTIVIK